MTQAFNLSQLANNVNTSGQLNAAAGLYNQVAVANGGTGLGTLTSGAVLIGAGTSAVSLVPAATSGNLLTANGTTWVSQAASGTFPVYTVKTSPGTWTKPATVKGISVTVVSGGGNGGTAAPSGSAFAGGGGGGTAIRKYPAASLPGPQPFTVGGAGASSSFGVAPATVISATGGANGGANLVLGGVGSSGQLNLQGGSPSPVSGAIAGGLGGSSSLGGGGRGGTPGVTASAGGAYGGGGGGGATSNTAGGAGAAGVVIIEEFY